jgi:CHAT domain-containing protein
VPDISTAFLMIKFYEEMDKFPQLKKGEIAIALYQAQQWLRNLTCEKFIEELNKYQPIILQIQQKLSKQDSLTFKYTIEGQLKKYQELNPQDKPFANPFYWAAFIAVGV